MEVDSPGMGRHGRYQRTRNNAAAGWELPGHIPDIIPPDGCKQPQLFFLPVIPQNQLPLTPDAGQVS
jgi:hypothetical protein